MTDAVAIARLDDFVGEQMQAPALESGGRCPAHGGNEEGFGVAVEFAGFAMDLFFTKHGGVHVAFAKALADELGREGADAELACDVLIVLGSLLLIGIGEKQYLGSVAFSLGAFVGSGDDFELVTLLHRKSDMVLFGGHEPLLVGKNAKRIPDLRVKIYYLEEVLVGSTWAYRRSW
jgi:hypothetical protein